MTRRQTLDERAEEWAWDKAVEIANRSYCTGEIIIADLAVAWLAGYRAAKADERAKAKAKIDVLRAERDESQIVAAYLAADLARPDGRDPFDVLDAAKDAIKTAIAPHTAKEKKGKV